MADLNESTVSTLNELIGTCRDGELGYRKASEDVRDPQLKTVFERSALERAKFIAELQSEVRRLGGEPEKRGSTTAALHRGWIDVKAAVTDRDDAAIISECERGEDMAVDAYKEALAGALPREVRNIVERQYRAVQDAHDRVRELEIKRTA